MLIDGSPFNVKKGSTILPNLYTDQMQTSKTIDVDLLFCTRNFK